jgi:hypothetical protein
MSDDLQHRLRDRSQRLWVTGQDLLDNLLFREAFDCIVGLERDYKEACNEAADCYTKQCVAEAKLIKSVVIIKHILNIAPEGDEDEWHIALDDAAAILGELEVK